MRVSFYLIYLICLISNLSTQRSLRHSHAFLPFCFVVASQSLDALLLFAYLDFYSSIKIKHWLNTSYAQALCKNLRIPRSSLHPDFLSPHEGDSHVNTQSEYIIESSMIKACEKYSRNPGKGGGQWDKQRREC